MNFIAGQRVGALTIIECIPRTSGGSVVCLCDCGKTVKLNACVVGPQKNSRRGYTSCGCGFNRRKHGMTGTSEHKIWLGMIARCCHPSQTAYPYYGGRGIKVCNEWLDKKTGFKIFLKDVGKRPSPTHSLDRIDPDGNYCLNNCRWATPLEQMTNRRWRYMTMRQYQYRAQRTAIYPGKKNLTGLVYTGLGLAGEAGEVANKIKKLMRGDTLFEITAECRRNIMAEAGGVLWYLSQLAEEMDVTLEDIARMNLQILEDRKERGVIQGSGDTR